MEWWTFPQAIHVVHTVHLLYLTCGWNSLWCCLDPWHDVQKTLWSAKVFKEAAKAAKDQDSSGLWVNGSRWLTVYKAMRLGLHHHHGQHPCALKYTLWSVPIQPEHWRHEVFFDVRGKSYLFVCLGFRTIKFSQVVLFCVLFIFGWGVSCSGSHPPGNYIQLTYPNKRDSWKNIIIVIDSKVFLLVCGIWTCSHRRIQTCSKGCLNVCELRWWIFSAADAYVYFHLSHQLPKILRGWPLPVLNGVIAPVNGLLNGFPWGYIPHLWSVSICSYDFRDVMRMGKMIPSNVTTICFQDDLTTPPQKI